MSNLIPFESAGVPATLNKYAGLFGSNNALMTRVGPSYPVLTIKGKHWRIVDPDTKERTLLKNQETGDALTSVQVVIVRANENLSKVFYKAGYEEGSDAPPDCSSNDGIKPDSMVKEPQCKTCAACEHNVWGSGKEGKGRACSDSRRIAVAPENDVEKVMLLRVPPASLKGLTEYGSKCNSRGLPYQAVVAKVSFDVEASTPKLVFSPIGVLDNERIEKVAALQEDKVVRAIIGLSDDVTPAAPAAEAEPAAKAPTTVAEAQADTAAEAAAADAKAKAAAKAEKKRKAVEAAAAAEAAAKAAAAAAAAEDDDDEDEVVAAPAAAKPAATVVKAAAGVPANIASMLDGLDIDD